MRPTFPESAWPAVPRIHDGEASRFRQPLQAGWRAAQPEREPYGTTFRTCYFCGSIHPGDLYDAIRTHAGVRLDPADQKYGYLHKLYVEGIPNTLAGRNVRSGTEYRDGLETPIISPAPPHSFAKFYTHHLLDDGFDAEALRALLSAISERSPIDWFIGDDGRVAYRSRDTR